MIISSADSCDALINPRISGLSAFADFQTALPASLSFRHFRAYFRTPKEAGQALCSREAGLFRQRIPVGNDDSPWVRLVFSEPAGRPWLVDAAIGDNLAVGSWPAHLWSLAGGYGAD